MEEQYKTFSLEEMFSGLMLLKNDITYNNYWEKVKLQYAGWLEAGVQKLFKQDVGIQHTYISNAGGRKITWEKAMQEFINDTNYGDKFIVIYSSNEAKQNTQAPTIIVYDIRKVSDE